MIDNINNVNLKYWISLQEKPQQEKLISGAIVELDFLKPHLPSDQQWAYQPRETEQRLAILREERW